jgi:lipoprotein-releasing system ATP-binding protein
VGHPLVITDHWSRLGGDLSAEEALTSVTTFVPFRVQRGESFLPFLGLGVIEVGMETVSSAETGTDGPLSRSAGAAHPTLISVRNLHKEYVTGRGRLVLFEKLSFTVAEAEMLAIIGQSGAGKSTLLHILGALDTPSGGDVCFTSISLNTLNARQAALFRNREVGYVWQFHYLLPEFTALENVAMPLLARGVGKAEALKSAERWLNEVELGDRVTHRAGELSGGEQQRVSLARALVTGPKVLLADEPTGDLDGQTADMVFSLIERLHATHGLTSVIVTHNTGLARRCDRILRLEKGRVERVSPQEV